MKPEAYSQGDAFQVEKRTVFSAGWLPLCAAGQLARPGDFFSATVGGWAVVGVRDKQEAVHVLRNACRHQNMPVVGTPSGNCESFRCRFHGWTYDLQGRFLGAPPPVAPKEARSPDLHLASLAADATSGMVFFSLGAPTAPAPLGALPAHGGTLTREIAGNWKVCVEHLVTLDGGSLVWPLLVVHRAGAATLVHQVVPHTFLRTRLLTHIFGRAPADGDDQAAEAIKQACERLQMERAEGKPAADAAPVTAFHRWLAEACGQDGVST